MAGPRPVVTDASKLDDHAGQVYRVIYVFLPITTLALGVRLYSRRRKRLMLSLDDYLAALSYATWIIFASLILWAVRNGAVGNGITTLPLPNLRIVYRVLYVGPVLTSICMTAAKFSILTLYTRVFSPSPSFRIQVRIVGGLCLAWLIAASLTSVFKCNPVRAGWDPLLVIRPGTNCVNFNAFIVAIEVPNCVLDFAVAGIAIGVLRGLQMSSGQKFGLGIMFLLCTIVAVVGLIRIGVTYYPQKFSPDATVLWVTVQNAISVICCCLPTWGWLLNSLGPFENLRSFLSNLSARSSLSRHHVDESRTVLNHARRPIESHTEGEYWELGPQTNFSHAQSIRPPKNNDHLGESVPMGQIRVQKTARIETDHIHES